MARPRLSKRASKRRAGLRKQLQSVAASLAAEKAETERLAMKVTREETDREAAQSTREYLRGVVSDLREETATASRLSSMDVLDRDRVLSQLLNLPRPRAVALLDQLRQLSILA